MRIICGLIIVFLTHQPYIVSGIYLYAFPREIYVGSKSTLPLSIISIALILLGILAIFLPQKTFRDIPNNEEDKKWPYFGAAWVSMLCGITLTLITWYYPPDFLEINKQAPLLGVLLHLIFSIVSSWLFAMSATKDRDNSKYLIRILIILSALIGGCFISLVLVLLLLYAFPSDPPFIAYPSAASICFYAYLIWGFLILMISRKGKLLKITNHFKGRAKAARH